MIKLFKLSISLLLLLSSACASVEVPKFRAFITLPASEDGYGRNVVTKEKFRIPRTEWEPMKKHGIIILSDDWKILRASIQKNCTNFKCKEMVGAFDDLFLTIDKALQEVPGH